MGGMMGRVPVYPDTAARFLQQTGHDVSLVGGGLWVCHPGAIADGAAAPDLPDTSGNGDTMAAVLAGAPVACTRNARRGVIGGTSTVSFTNSGCPWGAANLSWIGWAITSFSGVSDYATLRVYSSLAGTAISQLYYPDGSRLAFYAIDAGGSVLVNCPDAPVEDERPYFNGCQVDWSAAGGTITVLQARRGRSSRATGSCSFWGGIDTTMVKYIGGNVAGAHCEYAGDFTGAQAEGATRLDELAASLGYL